MSNYLFLLFPVGPRGCIGNAFAKMEVKCPLAATVGKLGGKWGWKSQAVSRGGSQRNLSGVYLL